MTDSKISPEDLEAFREAFREAVCKAFAIPPRLLGVRLPRRVRVRLWFHRHVDGMAYWLACRGCCTAAIWLWQLSGMW